MQVEGSGLRAYLVDGAAFDCRGSETWWWYVAGISCLSNQTCVPVNAHVRNHSFFPQRVMKSQMASRNFDLPVPAMRGMINSAFVQGQQWCVQGRREPAAPAT